MNLRHITARGPSTSPAEQESQLPVSERCLTLLTEGVVINVPEIDSEAYKAFRANVGNLGLHMAGRLGDDDKLQAVRGIVKEFELYRNRAETATRERLFGWRGLTATLLRELLKQMGIDPASAGAYPLVRQAGVLSTSQEIDAYRRLLDEYLHPGGAESPMSAASPLRTADRSTANDNAAGLRGGGSAIEHLRRVKAHDDRGFVVLFRLSCLDVIGERFGTGAVDDCLMAVSAYLTHSLRGEDAIYHWTDSSLLAILEERANRQILNAELQRIANQNRDITINIGGRMVMLRIPLEFDITPVARLASADDLNRISGAVAAV